MNMKRREDIKNSSWGCECKADTNVFLIPPNPRDDLHSAPAWVIDINGVYPHQPLPLPAHIIQFQIHNTAAPLTSTFLHQTNQQQHNEFIHSAPEQWPSEKKNSTPKINPKKSVLQLYIDI